MKKTLTALFVLFTSIMVVKAEGTCSYTTKAELTEKAANIRVNYEVKENIISPSTVDGEIPIIEYTINISVLNITEDFYVSVTNNDKFSEVLEFADVKDGIATINYTDTTKVSTFVFKVYATKDACDDNGSAYLVKTLRLTTPRYNRFYDREICADEASEFYLCQQFVDFDEINENQFLDRLNDYKEGKIDNQGQDVPEKKSVFDKIWGFIKDNKWYIIGGIVLVGGAGYGIYYVKTKKQRDLGL